MLIHSSCGGEVGIDKGKPPFIIKGDLFYVVKCVDCGQRLGVLPAIDDNSPYSYPDNKRRIRREDRWKHDHQSH